MIYTVIHIIQSYPYSTWHHFPGPTNNPGTENGLQLLHDADLGQQKWWPQPLELRAPGHLHGWTPGAPFCDGVRDEIHAGMCMP